MAKTFTRRSLLRTTGAGAMLSPFLSVLQGARAQAAPGPIKRVLIFATMGTQPEIWRPTAVSGENITTFSAATEPLAAIRENVVLIEGCPSGSPGEGHGSPQGLTGLGYADERTATSIDQFIAERLKANGVNTPIGALLLGDGTNDASGGSNGKIMFMKGGTQITPLASPRTAFNTVFGNVMPSMGGGGMATDKLKARRLRTIDLLDNELETLQGRLGSAERARLDRHRLSISQIRARLMMQGGTSTTPGAGCTPPSQPMESTNPLTNNRTHLDIIINAFACDITRVAGIHYGNDQSLRVDLPSVPLSGNQHSDFIHSGANEGYARLAKFEAWLAGEFAYVVTQLKNRDEPDGSGKMLDNTIIAWCRDLGEANAHNQTSMRFVLAGGANKYLKTSPMGRYIKRGGSMTGDRHERVLLSLCEAMGITTYTGFGDPSLAAASKKPLDGLSV